MTEKCCFSRQSNSSPTAALSTELLSQTFAIGLQPLPMIHHILKSPFLQAWLYHCWVAAGLFLGELTYLHHHLQLHYRIAIRKWTNHTILNELLFLFLFLLSQEELFSNNKCAWYKDKAKVTMAMTTVFKIHGQSTTNFSADSTVRTTALSIAKYSLAQK